MTTEEVIIISKERIISLIGTIKRNVRKEERKQVYLDFLKIFGKEDLKIAANMDRLLDDLL